MNVRSSNDASCYPAPSKADSNLGNPCSLLGNSLFPKSGNRPGGAPKSDRIKEAASSGSPAFGVFPCSFPANQGNYARDEFATDCTPYSAENRSASTGEVFETPALAERSLRVAISGAEV